MNISADIIEQGLKFIHRTLEQHNIWHCVTYGTLLGAVRDQAIITWDHDFDMVIKPENYFDVLALNPEIIEQGYHFKPTIVDGSALALNQHNITQFWNSAIGVFYQQQKIADLYIFFCFNDGVMRRFDFERNVYWCPHSSYPAWFNESLSEVIINGETYPAHRDAEKFLQGVYGDNWQTPYRAVMQGGIPRENTSTHGDQYLPKLADEINWCQQQGFDTSAYSDAYSWPRPILGAGPVGPTERTMHNSHSLWWRDLDELLEYF